MSSIKKTQHGFTLVELMVAMAVLIVMMGFLFQFTIGAQRIWTAVGADDDASFGAQITMQYLTDDLENAIVTLPATNPNDFVPFYLNNNRICFMTGNTGSVPYYVLYEFDSLNHILYRTLLENDINATNTKYVLTGQNGATGATLAGNLFTATALATSTNTREILCEKVHSFEINVMPATATNYFLDNKPRAVRVSFTLEQEARNGASNQKYRVFSKVIFLNQFSKIN